MLSIDYRESLACLYDKLNKLTTTFNWRELYFVINHWFDCWVYVVLRRRYESHKALGRSFFWAQINLRHHHSHCSPPDIYFLYIILVRFLITDNTIILRIVVFVRPPCFYIKWSIQGLKTVCLGSLLLLWYNMIHFEIYTAAKEDVDSTGVPLLLLPFTIGMILNLKNKRTLKM